MRRFITRITFKVFVFFKLFLFLSLECLIQPCCYGKRSCLTEYVLLGKFSNDRERREQVSIILSSLNYRSVYFIHLIKSFFVEDVLFYPKNEVMAFPKIEIKWDLDSQRCSCLHYVWHGNLILTILSCENPSNIMELNYRPQLCWSNKLTGKMVLVLLREEWISLFGRDTIQRYVFMLSTRLVRTSRNGLYRKMWSHFFLPHACDTKIFSLCWKQMNQSLKLIVIIFY